MKSIILIAAMLFISFASTPSMAEEAAVKAVNLDELVEKVRQSAFQDKQKNRQREKRFLAERNHQQKKLNETKQQLAQAQQRARQLREAFENNEKRLLEKERQLQQEAGDLSDVFAVTRQNAAELQSLVSRSMVTAEFPERGKFLQAMMKSNSNYMTLAELKKIWLLLLEEMNESGKVVRFQVPVITAQGEEQQREVMRVGAFTVTSQGHFLRYLPGTSQLVELARQPSDQDQQLAFELQQANDSAVYEMAVDPTKGSILSLLVQSPNIWERIRQGGIIGYLILVLGSIGLLIVIYRYLWLWWTERRLRVQIAKEEPGKNNPLGRLRLAARQAADCSKETLTLRLEETILSEAGRMKFGLATLTVFAAVTPLLGLLGTVTGMIETFQSISLYGTGDPKLMSSGISQALITTQLGLAVAIPLLLLHTFLQGKASRMIEMLEAQSVNLFEARDAVEAKA
ncbi:MotA/TolQ/ExbB proton channel family protein [Thiomicrorhabdus sp.]|uniref:MotA/TolQ/ExbB proton channel family protein n=1 Tax=Thiomicrorhabdus sp. TaxID=2039724 RepID=UPI0029C74700|nr:MotA/TolQ/ExbB proton channel family protein [Thiomicrorhabdus sp.]